MRWKFWERRELGETSPPEASPIYIESSPSYDPNDEPPPLGDVHRRGAAAHRLLNDPTLAEAFKELREDLYAEWLVSKHTRREELFFEAHALDRVTRKLISYRAAAQIRADSAN